MPHEPKPSAPSAADATAQPLDPMSVEGIFVEALSKEAGPARNGLLDMACQGNAELRMRVEALLRAYSDAGSFLNQPAGDWRNPPFTTAPAAPTDEHGIPSGLLRPSDEPGVLGTVGPYRVRELIGRGGMGIVLRAFDAKLNRIVAVKVLAPELAAQPTARRRFLREAQAAAAVSHPHVVTIHAVDEDEWPYLVMECIEGQSLQDKIERSGTLKLAEVLRIGTQIAEGLAAAHKQGLIHRDVKPANILLENGVERVKITDFGLARAADDVTITRPGEISGTPQYMSPEQASGERVDLRSDLFSLGCVLYAMCAGQPPFRADSIAAMVKKICDSTPQPLHEIDPQIPDWLATAIDRLLAKDPNQRFQSAAEVATLLGDALARLQAGQPPPSHAIRHRAFMVATQAFPPLTAWVGIAAADLLAGFWFGRFARMGPFEHRKWLALAVLLSMTLVPIWRRELRSTSFPVTALFVLVGIIAFLAGSVLGQGALDLHGQRFREGDWTVGLATLLIGLLIVYQQRQESSNSPNSYRESHSLWNKQSAAASRIPQTRPLPAWLMIVLTGLIGYLNGRLMPWHLVGVRVPPLLVWARELEVWLVGSLVVFFFVMLFCVPRLGAISSTMGALFVVVSAAAFLAAGSMGREQLVRHQFSFQPADWMTVLATALVAFVLWRHGPRLTEWAQRTVHPWKLAGWLLVILLSAAILFPVLFLVAIVVPAYQASHTRRPSPPVGADVNAGPPVPRAGAPVGPADVPALPGSGPGLVGGAGADIGPMGLGRASGVTIDWGEATRNVQLGWRIEPKKETYRVGELITVSLFLRNIGGQPIETTMPRTQILEKLGLDIGLRDSNDTKLPWRWSGAHKRGDEISGGFGITLRPNETFSLPPFMLKIGSSPLGNFETIMAELLVPEDTAETLVPDALPLSLIFKLSSIGHARGDEAELESEPFQFSVADDNGAP